jgi:hypothetical protein
VFDNRGRVGVGGVSRLPIRDRRDRACRVSRTVGEARGVGWATVELGKEEVGEDLRG